MTAGDYVIDVTIGTWTATIAKDDATDPAADAITMDPLTSSWSLKGGYPSQPNPETVSFGLYVPSLVGGPTPVQGTRVEITITTPDHALPNVAPVLDFVGKITDVEATPLEDGLAFDIVAADYRTDLGEERMGDTPWTAESRYNRLLRIIGNTDQPITIPAATQGMIDWAGFGASVADRDIDVQPIAALIDDLFSAAVIWIGMDPAFWLTGWIDGTFRSPNRATWFRAILGQSVDGAGNVTFPVCWLSGGLPDVDAALPYEAAMSLGLLELNRKAIVPDSSLVCWIPSTAIESDSVKWRQDKASNTNRFRVTAPDIIAQNFEHVGAITAEYPDLIAANGPNEVTIGLDADQGDYGAVTDLAWAMLGTHYDASPRWALDQITIRAEEIADGDQWPRLFNPRQHASIHDQAVGRFVLITDPAPKWSLHDRPDYFGRLAGATLTLSGGKIRWTATLAHRLPVGGGADDGSAYGYVPATVHKSITYAELGAGANPTYNQSADYTYADFELVEH